MRAPARSLCFLLGTALLAACGGGVRYMAPAAPGQEPLTAPPEGKVLVNVHRPSGYGGGYTMAVFDGEKMIGNSFGKTRFQYVCDPGVHHLLSWSGHVTVIEADLAAGGVYDLVVDVAPGAWSAAISLTPITKDHERRPKLEEWERTERLMVFVPDEKSRRFEADNRERVQEILRDFVGGEKSDRLGHLEPDDKR